jgi:hypothetical protein
MADLDLSEQARFAAREFVARLERELEEPMPVTLRDRVAFGYEIGFMHGWREGLRSASEMYDAAQKKVNDE